jgi:BirA family biotin operon repressor/biotin-[acetyl-CoA-carboxylase] ligase
MIDGRKVCGILVESAIEGNHIQHAILGIGINIRQRSFPPDISGTATSLFIETGLDLSPDDLLKPLLERADLWYRKAPPGEVLSRWEELSSYGSGRKVRVFSSGEEIEGVTRGLTLAGGLVVELASGERREVQSGEVSLRAAGE